MMGRRTKTVTAFFATSALGVVVAAAAYACTNLATLNLSNPSGPAGTAVTVTGSSFAVAKAGETPTEVVLHWNGVGGPEVARAVPDSAGNISASFAIPQGSPGYYVIVARQVDAKGVDKYGTPARASFQILGPGGQSAAQQPAGQTQAALASEPSSSGMIALTVGLGVLGLVLFGAGFTAFVRQARSREVPATAPARRD